MATALDEPKFGCRRQAAGRGRRLPPGRCRCRRCRGAPGSGPATRGAPPTGTTPRRARSRRAAQRPDPCTCVDRPSPAGRRRGRSRARRPGDLGEEWARPARRLRPRRARGVRPRARDARERARAAPRRPVRSRRGPCWPRSPALPASARPVGRAARRPRRAGAPRGGRGPRVARWRRRAGRASGRGPTGRAPTPRGSRRAAGIRAVPAARDTARRTHRSRAGAPQSRPGARVASGARRCRSPGSAAVPS